MSEVLPLPTFSEFQNFFFFKFHLFCLLKTLKWYKVCTGLPNDCEQKKKQVKLNVLENR